MLTPNYPYHVVIILTERCNLRCCHCSSSSSKERTRTMSFENAANVLRQLADVGVVDVAFSGGEPLLHPQICDLIKLAKSLGLQTGLSTNGYAITSKRIGQLLSAGLDRLQVSLDGLKTEHDRIRGDGAFEQALKAIGLSIESGLATNVCFTAMAENNHALGNVIDLSVGKGVTGFNLSKLVPSGRGLMASALMPEQSEDVFKILLNKKKRYPDIRFTSHLTGLCLMEDAATDVAGFIGCQAGIYISCVLVTGDVTPCVLFPKKVGNLFEDPFRELWSKSPVIQKLKLRELNGVCGKCDKISVCGGCRATAFNNIGDYLAEDPLCTRVRNHSTNRPVNDVQQTEPYPCPI